MRPPEAALFGWGCAARFVGRFTLNVSFRNLLHCKRRSGPPSRKASTFVKTTADEMAGRKKDVCESCCY